jgi:uncharacterized repeat protein (TIGR03833 family)
MRNADTERSNDQLLAFRRQRFLEVPMDGRSRKDIRPGLRVAVELKRDQRSGRRTVGVVKDILTSSASHPHGIKVRLTDGQIGRVKEILDGE